jgi:hypothetical protein
VLKDNKSLGIFRSINDLERQSKNYFGIIFFHSRIAEVCKGLKKEYKGYIFKYYKE